MHTFGKQLLLLFRSLTFLRTVPEILKNCVGRGLFMMQHQEVDQAAGSMGLNSGKASNF